VFLIKKLYKKFSVKDLIQLLLVSAVLFFAGINLGFNINTYTKPDKKLWTDMLYQFMENQAVQKFSKNHIKHSTPEVDFSVSNSGSDNTTESIEGAKIENFIFPSDTIEIDSTKINLEDKSNIPFIDSIPTTINKDSLRLLEWSRDSTARLEHFRYQREDYPVIRLKQKKLSKFFVEPSPTIKQRKISIDSTGKFVEIRELIGGNDSRILLRIPIEEYIQERLKIEERKSWESLGYAYELKKSERGLQELMKSFTDIEIPLPKVGVLSIFGEPKISLKIGGAVQIHGAWRSETTEGVTASRLGNTRNEPDFKQQVQINVNGTIGDKLNISADWNTERTFEYENQLKIKYTGYEDEIIQSIEAGNVSLQTAPLVGGSEALFGVKALFKMGPFSLTTLASQKKGETKEVEVSGGTTASEFQRRAYDYSTNHYFLDTAYASESLNIFSNYFGSPIPIVNNNYLVTEVQVWKSINVISTDKSREREANAFIDLPAISRNQSYPANFREPLTNPIPGIQEAGRFLLLQEGLDYIIQRETGFLTFKTPINDNDVIAVSFGRENGPGTADDAYFGEWLASGDTNTTRRMVLKLVKPKNLQPQYKTAWKLQLKNIYPTGVQRIKEEGFEFEIRYEVSGAEPIREVGNIRFLNAFGLDLLDASKQPNPDNKFDFRPNITVFTETGEVIFPKLQPFGKNLPSEIPSEYAYQIIYDTLKTIAQQDKAKDKWVLVGKSSGASSASYQLGFNLVENSVKVTLDGRPLKEGIDYRVDYNSGQLTITNSAALVPGANLRISYEQNDLFQLASKTLLGARGIYEFSKKTTLGFSILNLNQQTLSDKVRIGEEPLSNTIYGLDFNTSADLPFITRTIDKVFSTREMSSFSLSGELAYINPDPNTKKSTIASDGGKSIAYIDDFEGAKRTIPIGVSYTSWRDLSAPDSLPNLPELTRAEKMPYKGKTFWFNETPSNVLVQHIYGDRKQVARSDQQVTVMDVVFLPDTPGTYNWNPNLSDRAKVWGGKMKGLSSTASNLDQENIEYIEFWLQVLSAQPDAKMFIDLGRISEDVIPNNRLDTEDKDRNDAIDTEGKEDTGLDTLFDEQERFIYQSSKSDPSGDNFFFQRSNPPNIFDYFNINGTQGNAVLTDIGRIPDTEDLNRNGNLDNATSFFRYEIPLDTVTSRNPFIAGGGLTDQNWFLFRVPLKDFQTNVGNATFTNIEFIRIFLTGVNQPIHFRIGEFNLVGSQWQKLNKTDTILSVSVVSIEENPEYSSPPGVFQERDRTRPDENILRNEQSLNLIVNGLQDNQSREAIKYLFRPLDVFSYKQMKLFMHGDKNNIPGSISYNETLNGSYKYSTEVYFRFGTDSNNFYEYRKPILPGWNEITIDFEKITAIKQIKLDSTNLDKKFPVEGKPYNYYSFRGNPSLTSIKFFSVGIFNIDNDFNRGELSGQLWVNELRVVGADDSPGWAYSINTSLKFADLLTVNFNYSKKDPYFHRLSERFGSRVDNTNWSISTDLNVLKLIPISLSESNFRINYSHTEQIGKPLYLPNTDINVDEAVKRQENIYNSDTTGRAKSPQQLREESETETISDTWSASNIRIKLPSNWWLIRDTFNSLTFGANYNKTYSRNPSVERSLSWVWNVNMNYALNLSPNYFFLPIDIPILGTFFALFKDYSNLKVYFTPQNLNITVTVKRNKNINKSRPTFNPLTNQFNQTDEAISRDFTTQRTASVNWKITEGGLINLTTSYNLNISSSLASVELDKFGKERSESDIWRDIFTEKFFGKDFRYQQSIDLRTNPRLPSIFDLNKFLSVTAGYSAGYQWDYDFRQEEFGRSAGFNNRSNLGFNFRLKALFAPLFSDANSQQDPNLNRRNLVTTILQTPDTSESGITDTINVDSRPSALIRGFEYLKLFVKTVLFDYETISANFTNDNTLSKSGLKAKGTGMNNFFGLFHNDNAGPSRLFMLGLSSDVGSRISAPNTNLSDNYSQKNNLDLRTSRPLWEGAKIELNWKLGWSLSKSTTLTVDENGNLFVANLNSSGTLSRSFLSVPPFLFLSFSKSGIKRVNELYNPASRNPANSLSNAFIEGFESFPILSKLGFLGNFTKYIPRPNWRITWDGLEKLPFLSSIAKRISLDHSYTSTYNEGWKLNRDGAEEIQTQKIEYGFSPLAGLNLTFGQVWAGNLIGNLKYGTRTSYDLGITTNNINETFTQDIGFTFQYSKSGFEIPLFGVSLKNDIEISLSYNQAKNSIVRFEMNNFSEEGIPQDGTTRVTLEPRVKYTLSAKVTLSIFYKRTSVEPTGASRIPPTTTNEAGIDVNIVIN
jgi:cell surface protein SprA